MRTGRNTVGENTRYGFQLSALLCSCSVNHDISGVGFGLDAFREILPAEVQKGGAGSGLAGQSLTDLGKAPLHERDTPGVLDCADVPDGGVSIESSIVLDIVGVGRGLLHAQFLPRSI